MGHNDTVIEIKSIMVHNMSSETSDFMQLNVTSEIMSFVARFMDHFRHNFNVIHLWNSVMDP
jgi:uncharacterized protein (DUF1499 family)